MSHSKHNQQGFSAVETIVAIIVVAVIAAVAFLVLQANQSANKTLNNSTSNNSAKKTVYVGTADDQKALNVVHQAYVAYLGKDYKTLGKVSALQNYVSPSLFTSLSTSKATVNPVTCAQDLPTAVSYAVDKTSTTKTTTVVDVQEKLGTKTDTVKVSVDLASMKITEFACAQ